MGESLSLTYERYFAEFLNEESPVHLRLLASPTCVGFRYGFLILNSRSFSRKLAHPNRLVETNLFSTLGFNAYRIYLISILRQRMVIQ